MVSIPKQPSNLKNVISATNDESDDDTPIENAVIPANKESKLK